VVALKSKILVWLKACAKTSTAEQFQDDRRHAAHSREYQ